jgi:hypothetical protein
MTKNARAAVPLIGSRAQSEREKSSFEDARMRARVWPDIFYSAEMPAYRKDVFRDRSRSFTVADGNKCGRRRDRREEMGFAECAAAVSRRDFSTTISHDGISVPASILSF